MMIFNGQSTWEMLREKKEEKKCNCCKEERRVELWVWRKKELRKTGKERVMDDVGEERKKVWVQRRWQRRWEDCEVKPEWWERGVRGRRKIGWRNVGKQSEKDEEGKWARTVKTEIHQKQEESESQRRERTLRTICPALVIVHVTQKTRLQSIYELEPFKCVISSFSTPKAVCQNMTGCHSQAATQAETSTPMQGYSLIHPIKTLSLTL